MRYVVTSQLASERYVTKYVYENFDTKAIWLLKNEGIALVDCMMSPIELYGFLKETRECFIRHLFPVCNEYELNDIVLSDTILDIAHLRLDVSESFSIQYRAFNCSEKDNIYQNVKTAKKELLTEGYIYDESKPKQIVSLLIDNDKVYIGANDAFLNLSPKNGGIARYKITDNFISRSEFKLLEIFDLLEFEVVEGSKALDIGAAPGGWTKALVDKGFLVYSIDPGRLSEKLISNKSVNYFEESAQLFLKRNLDVKFDNIVNDMKMDSMKSFQIMLDMMKFSKNNTNFIFTIKLPKKRWDTHLKKLLLVMDEYVELIFLRQLSYNRSEVTAVFKRKE